MPYSRSTWSFRSILCAGLLSSTGCLTSRQPSPTPSDIALPRAPAPWIVADSADSIVDAVRIRIETERLAAALPRLLGPLPSSVSPPWRVHVVKPGTIPELPGPSSVRREWTGFTRWDVHEAWVVSAPGDSPESLRRLRHELTHVFLESTIGGGPEFPLWLQEGVPCCFEVGVLADGTPGGNRPRRRQLQYLLRARRGQVDLDSFLNRRADQPYSSNDYAVAWGVAYGLATNRLDPNGQSWLKVCLDAAARAANTPGTDVTAAVREAFDCELRKRGFTLNQWERHWRRTVMRLGRGWPFGLRE